MSIAVATAVSLGTTSAAFAVSPPRAGKSTPAATAPLCRVSSARSAQDFPVLPSAERERKRLGRTNARADFQPTGYALKPGGTLKVSLGELPKGATAEAVIGTYGYGRGAKPEQPRRHTLVKGSNAIPDAEGGVVWIRVSSEDAGSAGPVPITFGTQDVNEIPVFCDGKTHPGSWRRAIENSQLKDDHSPVQIVGKHVVLTVWRSSALKYADHDPGALLRAYENILRAEDRIAAIGSSSGEAPESPLRILASERLSGDPNATNYRISLPAGGAEGMLTVAGLKGAWGVWHELGHMQQQASWTPKALTETSVNVYSLAAQRSFQEEPSKAAPYDKKAHDFLDDPRPDKKFEDNKNFYVRLVMLEQLRAAFGDQFFTALHKEVRAHEQVAGDAQRRKNFMVLSSKIAGKDLTRFFTEWGWKPDESTRSAVAALHLRAPAKDPARIHLAAPTQVTSVVRAADGQLTLSGTAEPNSRLKTTSTPKGSWWDPVTNVPAHAGADGTFTLKTARTFNGQVAVTSYDSAGHALHESNHYTLPTPTHVQSAVRGKDRWITLSGTAAPNSRLKTTTNPAVGWYDPETGAPAHADADGTFTLKTKRTIKGRAAVKSYDPKTGRPLAESPHVALKDS
ncbi:M60 family metallopeptidase [Streptomyces kronopolitis]|uniref:M60 family metallopeptidase n=1 Tax=Streptomyces kronopolitis TaxID=1612435 RepID=UPI003D99FCFF